MRSVQGARRSVRWQARRIDGMTRDELMELGDDEIAELRDGAASHWTIAHVWAVRGISAVLVLLATCLVCAAVPDASPLRAESTLDGWLRAWGLARVRSSDWHVADLGVSGGRGLRGSELPAAHDDSSPPAP